MKLTIYDLDILSSLINFGKNHEKEAYCYKRAITIGEIKSIICTGGQSTLYRAIERLYNAELLDQGPMKGNSRTFYVTEKGKKFYNKIN